MRLLQTSRHDRSSPNNTTLLNRHPFKNGTVSAYPNVISDFDITRTVYPLLRIQVEYWMPVSTSNLAPIREHTILTYSYRSSVQRDDINCFERRALHYLNDSPHPLNLNVALDSDPISDQNTTPIPIY